MSEPFSKDSIFDALAELGLALSNKHRLQIMSLLTHGAKTGEQLVEAIGQSKAVTSAHLKVLRHAGLIHTRKEGKYVWYSLASRNAEELWLTLRDTGEKLLPGLDLSIRNWEQADPLLSPLTPEELKEQIQSKKFILLDLRPTPEFTLGHIPTAQNAPYAQLDEIVPTLKTKLPILIYCRGPYCQSAQLGTARIAKEFSSVSRLRFSVPEWRRAGLPLEY